ncbi:hypothetical protein BDF14DRAFT_1791721 [Spinellus fusiger]|nr:hypothetical protein BDF14DRAFT_1791721 [Spinellus fusiger]
MRVSSSPSSLYQWLFKETSQNHTSQRTLFSIPVFSFLWILYYQYSVMFCDSIEDTSFIDVTNHVIRSVPALCDGLCRAAYCRLPPFYVVDTMAIQGNQSICCLWSGDTLSAKHGMEWGMDGQMDRRTRERNEDGWITLDSNSSQIKGSCCQEGCP